MLTKYFLLEELKQFIGKLTEDRKMPVNVQKGDASIEERPPEIHKMRLPNSRAAHKYAPYIILQYITGVTRQLPGSRTESIAKVRILFCVFNEDEEEGALDLLNLMERVSEGLLKEPFFGTFFYLDREATLEDLIYPDDTRPFYAGEMMATFVIPETERDVSELLMGC